MPKYQYAFGPKTAGWFPRPYKALMYAAATHGAYGTIYRAAAGFQALPFAPVAEVAAP